MKQTQLVLWDWNGTLLNDLAFSIDLLNQLLRENGYPQQFSTRQYRTIFGFPIEDYYRRAGFDFDKHPFSVLAQRYMQMYANAEHCRLSEGCKKTLSSIRQQGITQVVLSASPLPLLQRQLDFYGLRGYFNEVLGLSDIYAKSKVELGKQWMQTSGFDPATAVMVGDTLHDAEVARALGVRCVLYSGGHQSHRILSEADCPVIDRLSQLSAFL